MIDQGLVYTLTTTAGSIQLNPTGFYGAGYYLQQIDADTGDAADITGRGELDGSVLGDTVQQGLRYGFSVIAVHTSASDRQTLEDNLRGYLKAGMRGAVSISWTSKAGTALTLREGRVVRRAVPTGRVGVNKVFAFEVAFPRAYVEGGSQTTTNSVALDSDGAGLSIESEVTGAPPWTFTDSGGGTLTCPNPGNTDERPVLRVTGPITSPAVVRTDTQDRVQLDASVSAGEYVDIDLHHGTIKLNGSEDLRYTLDAANSTLFAIPAGGTGLQLVGTGFSGATLLTSYTRGAWAA